ncbi:MAG: ATP-binding protein [Bacteriovoracia bacterium]
MNTIPAFSQTSSLIDHLRRLVLGVAVFFLIGAAVIFLSSQKFLRGLTEVNTANEIMEITSQVMESLDGSAENLEKLFASKLVSDTRYAYRAGMVRAQEDIQRALARPRMRPEIVDLLRAGQHAMYQYSTVVETVFSKIANVRKSFRIEEIRSDLLVARQFHQDAVDALRKVQITLRQQSDQAFLDAYQQRHLPLVVALIFAVASTLILTALGLGIVRKFGRAVNNLLTATDRVAQGNLDYRAAIIKRDEIGKLTYAFNTMVDNLAQGHDRLRRSLNRTKRLQATTTALAEALRLDQVAEIILNTCFESVQANAGMIFVLTEDRLGLEIMRAAGYPESLVKSWPRIGINEDLPVPEAYRTGRPLFLESAAQLQQDFPVLRSRPTPYASTAVIPLLIEGKVFGVLALSFNQPQSFAHEDRDFLLTLGSQFAQALHRAQLYDNAQKAIRIRDDFLSIASHELKTPLTPLKLQLHGLVRHAQKGTLKDLTPEKLKQLAESSDKQIGRLTHLIDDLLDVSRISAGKLSLNCEEFNLSELIEEVVNRYQQQLVAANCTVDVQIEPGITGRLDRLRIEQVLVNLLTNAAKYAPGQAVKVTLARDGEIAKLQVQDQGPGISPEDQNRIFDRFEQGESGSPAGGGLGLGLYISRQIVQAHGGDIRVKSKKGHGSTFVAELPLDYSPTEHTA